MRNSPTKSLSQYIAGLLIVCGIGLMVVWHPYGMGLRRLGFDLLFHSPLHLHQVNRLSRDFVIVYLDDLSHRALGQPYDRIWDRSPHAHLLNRLTEEGARLVFYDIVFDLESSNEESDLAFETAIAENGKVIMGAGLDRQEGFDTDYEEIIIAPNSRFRRKALAWGMINSPLDPDQGIRILATGNENIPTATWKTALLLEPDVEKSLGSRLQERWINYTGYPDSIPSVSFMRALQADGLKPGFFKNKIVFIGAKGSVGFSGSAKDTFRSPYRDAGRNLFYNGVEIHVMALENLLNLNWFTLLTAKREAMIVAGLGVIFVLLLTPLRPLVSFLGAFAGSIGLAVASVYICRSTGYFYSWIVPSFIMAPTAFLWSAGCHYYIEVRRRNRLKKTFSAYLSPIMVKRLAEADEEPQLGGYEENITVFFSDVENFSSFSERLSPTQLTDVMNLYLTEMTEILREQGGTLDKYIGDAIVAMFGAPLEMKDHAYRACCTAAKMQECLGRLRSEWSHKNGNQAAALRELKARIGINTGIATVGNFGSKYRLNYTMMADMVNLAARCESGAKAYGVYIMLTEDTKAAVEEDSSEFVFRFLDKVRVKGRQKPANLYELLGFRAGQPESALECIHAYQQALDKYFERDWDGAVSLLQHAALWEPNRPAEAKAEEGDNQKVTPSILLRNRCLQMKENPPNKDWDGVYTMSSK